MSDIVSLAVGIAAHRRINSIKSDMRAQKLNLDESELSAVSMRQDIEKLYMLVEALWLIVKETSGINDEDLAELVNQTKDSVSTQKDPRILKLCKSLQKSPEVAKLQDVLSYLAANKYNVDIEELKKKITV